MMVNDAGSVGLNSYLHEAPHQFVSYIELLQQKPCSLSILRSLANLCSSSNLCNARLI